MPVIIREPAPEKPEPEIVIDRSDADLIADIAEKLGAIQAMKVFRWKTDSSLSMAKKFVEDRVAEREQRKNTLVFSVVGAAPGNNVHG